MEDAEQEQGHADLAPVCRHDVEALREPVILSRRHLLKRGEVARMLAGAIMRTNGGHDGVEGRADLRDQSQYQSEG